MAAGRSPACHSGPQLLIYVMGSDFLLYWTHRIFHGNSLWRFHVGPSFGRGDRLDDRLPIRPRSICGSAGFWLPPSCCISALPRRCCCFWWAFDTTTAAFVHANLNWTFGPLKYVVATPVFHRWHHTPLYGCRKLQFRFVTGVCGMCCSVRSACRILHICRRATASTIRPTRKILSASSRRHSKTLSQPYRAVVCRPRPLPGREFLNTRL